MGLDYVYVDIFVSNELPAIVKIVVKPMGSESEVLQIDDFSIGLYEAPTTSSG